MLSGAKHLYPANLSFLGREKRSLNLTRLN
jgi:hypothetical protein